MCADERLRKTMMLLTTALLWGRVVVQQFIMMREDGIAYDPREWRDLHRFLFKELRARRRLRPLWRAYFEEGFHPWNLDDSALIERWREDHGAQLAYRKRANPANVRAVPPREP